MVDLRPKLRMRINEWLFSWHSLVRFPNLPLLVKSWLDRWGEKIFLSNGYPMSKKIFPILITYLIPNDLQRKLFNVVVSQYFKIKCLMTYFFVKLSPKASFWGLFVYFWKYWNFLAIFDLGRPRMTLSCLCENLIPWASFWYMFCKVCVKFDIWP